jgi:hypothetical protein
LERRWPTNARAWRVNGEQVAYRQIRDKDKCPLRIREADWVTVAGLRGLFEG